jgi:hypothetical protein
MKLNLLKKLLSVALTSTFFLSLNILPAQAAGVCSGNIYWGGNDNKVGRAIITNSAIASTNDSFIVSEVGREIWNIAEDENYFYFSDSSNFLWKSNKTTSVRTDVFASSDTSGFASGITGGSVGFNLSALAVANGKLYIGGLAVIGGGPTDVYENKFYRYDIASDGTISNEIDLQTATGFTKVVTGVDVDSNYVYYISRTEIGHTTVPNYVGRANLDGTSANNTFITIGNSEQATHLKVNSNYIYWADYATAIRRADIDGRNVTTLLTSSRMEKFAIDSNYIYLDRAAILTDPSGIARANIDGTGLIENYISTSAKPIGILASTTACSTNQDDGALKQTTASTEVVTPDAVFNLKNKKYLSKYAMKIKLSKNKSFKRNSEDLYKYSIFKASKKTCKINGNYVTGLKKTGTCDLYATRTTNKGVKYKYWVQINYIK